MSNRNPDLKFLIPGPPVGKERPRVTRSGHAYTPEKTRKYERWVRECAGYALLGRKGPWPTREQYTLELHIVYASKTRPDHDNVEKAILDGLEGSLFDNDRLAIVARKSFDYDKTNPRVEVSVWIGSMEEAA